MEKKGIVKSATLVTVMMLSFKVLGFIKQAVIAYFYGASLDTDIYFIAWGGVTGASEAIVKALSIAVVSVYTELLFRKGKKEASRLINGLLEVMLPIFGILVALIFIFSPFLSYLLAPSYKLEQLERLSWYIRILAPVLIFVYIELIFGAILDSNKSFFLPRLQSFIYSAFTVLCCVLLAQTLGVNALIIAQYASCILFSIILIIAVKKYHHFFLVKVRDIPTLKSILFTAMPLFIGNSAIQINQIVDKSITSGLGEGVASALSYCQTLEQFVTNIMIVNIGNVMFANFAEYVAKGMIKDIQDTLAKAINLLIAFLLGISVVTIIEARDIVSIVYYRGNFSYDVVVLTSMALIGYSVSFVGVAVRDLSIKSLYAFKDTKHPMIASLISICINIFFSILLSKHIGIIGVSLATSISVLVGMILNARNLKRYLCGYKYMIHFRTLLRCTPGAAILFCICLFIHNYLDIGFFLKFVLSSILGLSTYFLILYICGISEVRYVFNQIKNRRQKR